MARVAVFCVYDGVGADGCVVDGRVGVGVLERIWEGVGALL